MNERLFIFVCWMAFGVGLATEQPIVLVAGVLWILWASGRVGEGR